jgi:hypothetical protein
MDSDGDVLLLVLPALWAFPVGLHPIQEYSCNRDRSVFVSWFSSVDLI